MSKLKNRKARNDLTYESVADKVSYNPLTGEFTKIDQTGNYRITTITRAGYVTVKLNNRWYSGGRVAILLSTGNWPDGYVDHINGNPLDNRLSNLRVGSNSQNQQNKVIYKNNSTGFMGVYRDKRRAKPYAAMITINGEKIWLGYFDSPEEAHAVYVEKKKEIHPFFNPSRVITSDPSHSASL